MWNLSSDHRVARPPEEPLSLMDFSTFFFHFRLLISIFLSIPRDYTHYLLGLEWVGPPLEGLVLVFLPMDISMVDWLPCIFCLFASSSLASL